MRCYCIDIELLKHFNNELSELEYWLEESYQRLEELSKDNVTNDVEAIEHRLKQVQSLSDRINQKKPKIEKLQTSTNRLLENSEPKFASVLNNKLEVISHKWNAIVDGAKSLNDKYEETLKKNDEVIV